MAKPSHEFRPIPNESEGGHIALSIYAPGEWFDSTEFEVFVGGCGVGGKKTLQGAKRYLLARAKVECLRRINRAKKTAAHYQHQLEVLEKHGLQ